MISANPKRLESSRQRCLKSRLVHARAQVLLEIEARLLEVLMAELVLLVVELAYQVDLLDDLEDRLVELKNNRKCVLVISTFAG